MSNARIDQLKAEIREIELAEQAERDARKASVRPVRSYTFTPNERNHGFYKILDESCKLYRLECKVVNKAEMLEVGYTDHDLHEGGMTYLFNTLSGKIVMSTGGGNVHISDGSWSDENKDAIDLAWARINAFLTAHPEGGDVTLILEEYNQAKDEYREAKRAGGIRLTKS